jgi:hypothetical protein
MLIEIAVSILLAAAPAAIAATPAAASSRPVEVSWAELREAIAACVCAEIYTHEEKDYLVPRAGQCGECRPPAPDTALSLAVESAYEAARPILMSLDPPGLDEVRRNDSGLALEEGTRLTRLAYLGHDPFLRLLLNRMDAALAERRLACPDCPALAPLPMRHVAWAELLPYLAAHLWPDPVVTPTGDGESPAAKPEYRFHICILVNGVAAMDDPDPLLARAGFLGAIHGEGVVQSASAHFSMILKEQGFQDIDNDEERTRYLRRRLPEEIARDAGAKAAVCSTLDGFSADLGLVVDGCEEAEAPAAGAAPGRP